MRPLRWLLLLVLLVAALVGCAGGAATPAEPVETSEVTMPPSYRFEPAAIRVPAGTTVTWDNRDNFSHSVQVTNADLPFLELEPGETGGITFTEAGEYTYVCTYHAQDMRGTVIVTQP